MDDLTEENIINAFKTASSEVKESLIDAIENRGFSFPDLANIQQGEIAKVFGVGGGNSDTTWEFFEVLWRFRFIKRGDKMNSEQIEKFKQEIECIIKEKNYISLRYVLFDETNRTPFAVHIFNKDDLFMVNSRDERAHVIGRTFEFDNFSEAEKNSLKYWTL